MRLVAAIAGLARRAAGGILDLVLPDVCAACHAADAGEFGLCQGCNLRLLELVVLPYCIRCGASLGPNVPAREDGCSACPQPLPRFDRIVRLGPYADPLRVIVRELKYRRQDRMRRRLGAMLGQAVAARCLGPPLDLVLPVPMHWRRRITRGYDHAGVLARAVAGELQIPVGDELARIRATPPQAHLPRSRRLENVRGAFAVSHAASIQAARILLVDDVTTTGATANEAARTLLQAGASSVTLAVVCKSEPPKAYADLGTGSQ